MKSKDLKKVLGVLQQGNLSIINDIHKVDHVTIQVNPKINRTVKERGPIFLGLFMKIKLTEFL